MAEYLNLLGLHKVPLIRQSAAAECGLACLAMISWYHGQKTGLEELRRRFEVSLRGVNLMALLDVARRIELGGRGIRCDVAELDQLQLPAMLHFEFNHFVVLTKVRRGKFYIHDPAIGERVLRENELDRLFTGVAVEFTPTENFKPKAAAKQMALGQMVSFDRGLLSSL